MGERIKNKNEERWEKKKKRRGESISDVEGERKREGEKATNEEHS